MVLGGVVGGIVVAAGNALLFGRPLLAMMSGIVFAAIYAVMAFLFLPPGR